jgi:uncharacterized protein
MRFTEDLNPKFNVVRSYRRGELRINDAVFRGTVIVAASAIRAEPDLTAVAELAAHHAARILELEPEVVLIGTGERQVFPAAAFGARFLQSGIGFEVMDTGAACRTFNVLVGEHRRAVALLIV